MLLNHIHTEEISVVVQGAVDASTPKCLQSIRKVLPDAKIILSTWKDSQVDELEYDVLITNQDPGAFPCDVIENSIMNNINRQLVSSYEGLKCCTGKYAIKMRTDFYLESADFLNYFNRFDKYNDKYKFVKSRIVGCTSYSRNPRSKIPSLVMPYCPSDFFFFGYSEDILKLFSRELITSIEEKMYFDQYPEKRELLNYKDALCRFMPEQSIWMGFIQKNMDNLYCDSRDHITKKNQYLTEITFVNNLVLCSCQQLGINTAKKDLFTKGIPENCITYKEWVYLYQFYCEGNKIAFRKYLNTTAMEDKKYFLKTKRKSGSRNYPSIQNFSELPAFVKKYDYISFDLFDTLIFRYSAPDWQAMAQTSEYMAMLLSANGILASVPEIDKKRNQYIDYYGKISRAEKGSYEYKSRVVISKILQEYGVKGTRLREWTEQIAENECMRECCGIYVNQEALPVIRKLHKEGRKLIIISDMYISNSDIQKILKNAGLDGMFCRIFVSSDFLKTKSDGKLYEQVLHELGIHANQMIHIGDNLYSDVQKAYENGILGVYYENKSNIGRKSKLEQQVIGSLPKNFIGRALNVNDQPDNFRDYIQSYFSYDFINFVYDTARKVLKENIQAVYFLERDGTFFGEIYNKLMKEIKIFDKMPEIKCIDLKLSRKDTACMTDITNCRAVIERAGRVYMSNQFHLLNILGCYGISISDFPQEVQTELVNHNSDIAYFEKNYQKLIYPKLQARQCEIIDYLSDKGMFEKEKIAVVDIGWAGTMQKDIVSYLKRNYPKHMCYGFYYACDERAGDLVPYYSQYHFAPILNYAYSLLEFLVKRYTKDKKELERRCKKNRVCQRHTN